MGEIKSEPRESVVESSSRSGGSWAAIRESLELGRPHPVFDEPREITAEMIRGLHMIDETIVVHRKPPGTDEER